MDKSLNIKDFIINHVSAHPCDIVNLAIETYGISRPAVHKHISALIKTGKIETQGKTRNKRYRLATQHATILSVDLTTSRDEHILWTEKIQPILPTLPSHIINICEYGFTEMVNNAIDHAHGTQLSIFADFEGPALKMMLQDNGIGIFQKIKNGFHLENYREAILHLSKGKVTTDPQRHTGEGIFFSSRAFDFFAILANGLCYTRLGETDWLIDEAQYKSGTMITMTLNREHSRTLAEVFNQYAAPEDDYRFSKTHVLVELGRMPDETYISRSQAKRILWGLDKFQCIILDFKRVSTVGQGFVDEVFRVFQNNHPDIKITTVNANENVEFMIKRSLS